MIDLCTYIGYCDLQPVLKGGRAWAWVPLHEGRCGENVTGRVGGIFPWKNLLLVRETATTSIPAVNESDLVVFLVMHGSSRRRWGGLVRGSCFRGGRELEMRCDRLSAAFGLWIQVS